MPVLALGNAFTARSLGVMWNNYEQSLGVAPYLGRSFFGTDKKIGLKMSFIKGRNGLPVALKGANFDAKAPLRNAIGFSTIENEMPFFRESYMVSEKEQQEYDTFVNTENVAMANQILKEIAKKPLDLIMGADVVPERMIWSLLAPVDGVPKIDVVVDGGDTYTIDYTGDNGVAYKAKNYMGIKGASAWSNPATATPIADVVALQDKAKDNGDNLSTFVMNRKTWKEFMAADDTRLQVLGAVASQAGMMLKEADVKSYLLSNYGITILEYNKLYVDENGATKPFIPDDVVSAISGAITTLGTVWYGTTPEERSGSLTDGTLSIVNTGVAVYTYTTNHPINTHCVVSEIVLPSYENMDRVYVMNVNEQ